MPEGAADRQQAYLNALKIYCPKVDIIEGYMSKYRKVKYPLADDENQKVEIIKTEEKQTDVNLAIHLINDAWLEAYDCAILVSRDSDFAQALKLVKQHHEEKMVYIATMQRKHTSNLKSYRTPKFTTSKF